MYNIKVRKKNFVVKELIIYTIALLNNAIER